MSSLVKHTLWPTHNAYTCTCSYLIPSIVDLLKTRVFRGKWQCLLPESMPLPQAHTINCQQSSLAYLTVPYYQRCYVCSCLFQSQLSVSAKTLHAMLLSFDVSADHGLNSNSNDDGSSIQWGFSRGKFSWSMWILLLKRIVFGRFGMWHRVLASCCCVAQLQQSNLAV